jgi:adenylate kinase family enzyme
MKKVAVFGNAGGGKSALAQRLAALTGLPLYVVDMMRFRPGGAKVPHDEFSPAHADILRRDEWIIDGFGNTAIAWERLAATVTLIHVDLPLFIHFRWITKRLIKGLFADPARLARKQSAMEQLRAKLWGALALPPAPHTRVPAARHGGSLHRRGRTT